jgi:hypothetical protein
MSTYDIVHSHKEGSASPSEQSKRDECMVLVMYRSRACMTTLRRWKMVAYNSKNVKITFYLHCSLAIELGRLRAGLSLTHVDMLNQCT